MFVMRPALGATPTQMLTTATSSSTAPTTALQRRSAANSGADVQATPVRTTTTTVSQSTTPQPTPCDQAVCRSGYAAFLRRHPELRDCLGGPGSADERTYVYVCCAQQTGSVTLQRFLDGWNAFVEQAQRQRGCAPPPATDAPPPMPPPPTPDDYDEPMEIPVEYPEDGGAGDTGTTPVSQPSSVARVWGPIVGIGLIAAVALTLSRKRKLTSKRRRR